MKSARERVKVQSYPNFKFFQDNKATPNMDDLQFATSSSDEVAVKHNVEGKAALLLRTVDDNTSTAKQDKLSGEINSIRRNGGKATNRFSGKGELFWTYDAIFESYYSYHYYKK